MLVRAKDASCKQPDKWLRFAISMLHLRFEYTNLGNASMMPNPKPYAPAAERNKQAILLAMQEFLHKDDTVFEFGSGTGQHACHIVQAIPGLIWQPSDLQDKLAGIQQWIKASGCDNILPPIQLDLNDATLPACTASVCFSANTLHIISWKLVEKLFQASANIMKNKGKLCIYGPFSFDGQFTSKSNYLFDQQLRRADPDSGIREVAQLQALATDNGYKTATVTDMPANNHLLIWSCG